MTDMYQIKMYLINHNDKLTDDVIKWLIESAFERYNSLCVSIRFDEMKCKDIGEFEDDSKFNFSKTDIKEYRKEFETKC